MISIFHRSQIPSLVCRSICRTSPFNSTRPLAILPSPTLLQRTTKNLACAPPPRPLTAPRPLAPRLGGPTLHMKTRQRPLPRVPHPWFKAMPPQPQVTTVRHRMIKPPPRVAPPKGLPPVRKAVPLRLHRIPTRTHLNRPTRLRLQAMDNLRPAVKRPTDLGKAVLWSISCLKILPIVTRCCRVRVSILPRCYQVLARLHQRGHRRRALVDRRDKSLQQVWLHDFVFKQCFLLMVETPEYNVSWQ